MMSTFGKRFRWLAYFLAGLLGVVFLSFGFVATHPSVAKSFGVTLNRSQLSRSAEVNYEAARSHLEPNFYH